MNIHKSAEWQPGIVHPAAEIVQRRRIAFTVHAVPVAQPRQRHALLNGCLRNYTPSKHPVNAFKASVRMSLAAASKPVWWDMGASLRVTIIAIFPRPKSRTKKRGPNPREPKASKPDFDNVAKAVTDALTGLAYHDDAQIVACTVEKWIAAGDELPRVEVTIEEVTT